MPDIRVLPTHLVNKIAAGEVIERPASIVKELVENSIDAGATAIDVDCEDGGRRLIAVRDNGCGMGADDLALAFASHATSKIADDEDLFAIRTMGFRGEALASIAAVSHARIVSRPRGSAPDAGHEIRTEGETHHPVRPASAPEGTTVAVRDLFYNTPARRKFMRTASTEFGHISEQLARLAMPHPRIAFTLTHNKRRTQDLPATDDLRVRAEGLFGPELAAPLISLSVGERGMRIGGLLGPPSAARASGRWQYFFLNGRYVRDRVLSHALREAYRGLTDPSRFPVAMIFLTIDPAEVDVNVHPAKLEVRFRQSQLVHSQLLGALRDTLNRSRLAPAAELVSEPAPQDEQDEGLPPAEEARRQSLKQAMADFFKSQSPPQRPLDFPPTRPASGGRGDGDASGATWARRPAQPADAPAGPPMPSPAALGGGMAAMQVLNSYIVTATDDGLAIIDQHALHERILYEELSRRLASEPLTAQRLLIPETVLVTAGEKAALAERTELLERLGVELTEFGPDRLAVHKLPALLAERRVSAGEFLRDLLDVLGEQDAAGDPEALLGRILATMACKAAVKAGDPLTPQEMDALLARRREVSRGSACPHGRPTALVLTRADLDRQFKRT
ncbi:MAG TPA: DNA mismatch repair endonuclease MutL [Phycisphaerae bacterium]|nr:DNA mismatch repair endonuclease MutL [Phycisphaerae bacterium]